MWVFDVEGFGAARQVRVQHFGMGKAKGDVLDQSGVHSNSDLGLVKGDVLFGQSFVHFVLKLFQEFLIGSCKLGCQVPGMVVGKFMSSLPDIPVASFLNVGRRRNGQISRVKIVVSF